MEGQPRSESVDEQVAGAGDEGAALAKAVTRWRPGGDADGVTTETLEPRRNR